MNPRSAVHGGVSPALRSQLHAQLGAECELIDLSINLIPEGTPASVLDAVRNCQFVEYPDPTASELRVAYGKHLDLAPDRLVFGNGATELLWSLARLLCSPTRAALMVEPTFSEYARAAESCGAPVRSLRPDLHSGFNATAQQIATAAAEANAKSAYLCRPNNPTGGGMAFSELEQLAERLGETTLILDESFLSLSEFHTEEHRDLPSNVVRVRSLTKDFAMAGLRVGYLVTTSELAQRMEQSRPPWTTSTLAQAAAFAILREQDQLELVRAARLQARDELHQGLRGFGLDPLPSTTLFSLVDVGGGEAFRRQLMNEGVIVRDTASFGLPNHVRIAAGTANTRARLWHAIRSQTSLQAGSDDAAH